MMGKEDGVRLGTGADLGEEEPDHCNVLDDKL